MAPLSRPRFNFSRGLKFPCAAFASALVTVLKSLFAPIATSTAKLFRYCASVVSFVAATRVA